MDFCILTCTFHLDFLSLNLIRAADKRGIQVNIVLFLYGNMFLVLSRSEVLLMNTDNVFMEK